MFWRNLENNYIISIDLYKILGLRTPQSKYVENLPGHSSVPRHDNEMGGAVFTLVGTHLQNVVCQLNLQITCEYIQLGEDFSHTHIGEILFQS